MVDPSLPPPWLVRAVLRVRRWLIALADRIVPAPVALLDRMAGIAQTQLLHAAVTLRVADHLREGPMAPRELVDAIATDMRGDAGDHGRHVDEDALRRVLDALVALGVFAVDGTGCYRNNALSAALREDANGSMAHVVRYFGSGLSARSWIALPRALASGEGAFELAHGCDVWRWLQLRDADRALVTDAIGILAQLDADLIAAAFPFNSVDRVCDLGGGDGTLLEAILRHHLKPRGVLVDDRGVLDLARRRLERRAPDLIDRIVFEPMNIFEAVPSDCDAFVLRHALQNFDDPACEQTLRVLRDALGARPGAQALIIETLHDPRAFQPSALTDVHLMVMTGQGRERTRAEYEELFTRADLRVRRVTVLPTQSAVIEVEIRP